MKIGDIARITRAPFFTATIVPVLLGTAIGWYDGNLNWGLFVATLIGAIAINAGLDMSNDYFDHRSGTDAANRNLTPFSGGSRTIQDGVLKPRTVLLTALAFYAVGIGIGLYLAATRGWTILTLGAIGVFLAFFHNAPPFNLYKRFPGAGELAVGIGCGPITVLGAYFVQTQRLSLAAFLVSLPVALLITALLYINEFHDVESDRMVGKKTIPVVVGRARAVWGYAVLIGATYVAIGVAVAVRVLPIPLLFGLLSLPLALRAVRGAFRHHSDTPQLIPVSAGTIQIHLITGLLLCVGTIVAGLIR
ncbi:1,4-dihydroxy-2-naphthoate octaprenyltransferase [Candidatus Bipolaricaulota bacterium]